MKREKRYSAIRHVMTDGIQEGYFTESSIPNTIRGRIYGKFEPTDGKYGLFFIYRDKTRGTRKEAVLDAIAELEKRKKSFYRQIENIDKLIYKFKEERENG